MRLFLIALLFTGASYAQDGLHVTPTGDSDRGPWTGPSLVVDATRCSEFKHVMSDIGARMILTGITFEALAGVGYITEDSTATTTMSAQRYNLSFDPSNPGTFLSSVYWAVARKKYAKPGDSMASQFSLRNAHATIAARPPSDKRTELLAGIERILTPPGDLE